jgi:hypothetical protein
VHTNIVAGSRFSGLSTDEEADRRAHHGALHRRRGYGPEQVAGRIVRAVETGRDVVSVTPAAHLQYHVNRLAPARVRFTAARVKLTWAGHFQRAVR